MDNLVSALCDTVGLGYQLYSTSSRDQGHFLPSLQFLHYKVFTIRPWSLLSWWTACLLSHPPNFSYAPCQNSASEACLPTSAQERRCEFAVFVSPMQAASGKRNWSSSRTNRPVQQLRLFTQFFRLPPASHPGDPAAGCTHQDRIVCNDSLVLLRPCAAGPASAPGLV